MAYEYKCTWVPNNKINDTLTEWVDKGWEFLTATCGVAPANGQFFIYLFFRAGQPD